MLKLFHVQHAAQGDFQLVLSPLIIQEAEIAIAKIAPSGLEALSVFLDAAGVEEVPTPSQKEIQENADLIRVPKDVHVGLAAIKADIDFLITQDRDFTDRDQTTEKLHQKLKSKEIEFNF